MPRWPKREEGMEQPKRARRRKPETAKANLEPPLKELRRTGCPPEVGSEGYAEKYRAVVNGGYSKDEPVGQRWGKVEPALAFSSTHRTKVFAVGTVRKIWA